jgi:outer membrane protein TolC
MERPDCTSTGSPNVSRSLASWRLMVGSLTFINQKWTRLIGQLRLRRAQQREAAIAYQRTVLAAWHEIDNAMADFAAAQRQRERLAAAVADNRAAVRIAQQQYAQGAADFLNVLTMQDMLPSTQNQLVQASAEVSASVARLYRALGGGWENTYPEVQTAPHT